MTIRLFDPAGIAMINKLNDDGKLKRRFYNKQVNAAKEGIEFCLSFTEYCELLNSAGVVSSDLGISGYHLSRKGDAGNYEIGNCRFIHYKENLAERKVTEAWRAASRRNRVSATQAIIDTPPEIRRSWYVNRVLPLQCREDAAKLQRYLDDLNASGIDLQSWGAIAKLANRWGVSHTHVARVLKQAGLARYKRKSATQSVG